MMFPVTNYFLTPSFKQPERPRKELHDLSIENPVASMTRSFHVTT